MTKNKNKRIFAMRTQRRRLACSNCTADQHLCFCYTDSSFPLLHKSNILSFKAASVTTGWYVSDLDRNLICWFSHVKAHVLFSLILKTKRLSTCETKSLLQHGTCGIWSGSTLLVLRPTSALVMFVFCSFDFKYEPELNV